MTDRTKTLEQEEVLYEFDAQRYSLFGKPLGTDRVLIVRTEDGRARFTTRELDGSLAIGQLQLGAAAAEEILRLKAAATASDKEIEALRAELADWHESAERAAGESCGDEQHCTCVGALRARIKELEEMVRRQAECLVEFERGIGSHNAPDDCFATGPFTGDAFRDLIQCPACSALEMYRALMVPPIPLPEGEEGKVAG